jgi:hypothetical protein
VVRVVNAYEEAHIAVSGAVDVHPDGAMAQTNNTPSVPESIQVSFRPVLLRGWL